MKFNFKYNFIYQHNSDLIMDKQYWNNYYKKNKRRIIEKNTEWQQKNQNKVNSYLADYYQKNKKDLIERQKKYYKENIDYYRDYMRDYMRKYKGYKTKRGSYKKK